MAATVLTLALAAPAVASTGGSNAQDYKAPPATATGAFAGKPTRIAGHGGVTGQVAVDVRVGKAAWEAVGITVADSAGDFSIDWTPKKAGRFDVRVTPLSSASASEARTLPKISVYRSQKATWYGPGFYGNKTACGQRLRKSTVGVAHRTLPCGSKVEFYNKGKKLVVPVIDRGPFVRGVTWDLTLPAMKRLGSKSTIVLGAIPLR